MNQKNVQSNGFYLLFTVIRCIDLSPYLTVYSEWLTMQQCLIAWRTDKQTILQLSAHWPGLWIAARLEMTLSWYRPHCFFCLNQVVLMLTSLHLNEKSREVCIKPRSPQALLVFHRHTTVKWSTSQFLVLFYIQIYLVHLTDCSDPKEIGGSSNIDKLIQKICHTICVVWQTVLNFQSIYTVWKLYIIEGKPRGWNSLIPHKFVQNTMTVFGQHQFVYMGQTRLALNERGLPWEGGIPF